MNLSKELTDPVNAHLDEVRKVLGNLPADERKEILQDIESHIYDAVESRGNGNPTPELIEAVIAEMDPPDSYGETPDPSHKKKNLLSLTIILAFVLIALSIAGIKLLTRSHSSTKPRHDNVYSLLSDFNQNRVKILSIKPDINAPLISGRSTVFEVKIGYTLTTADSASVTLVIQSDKTNLLPLANKTEIIERGNGTVVLSAEINIPNTKAVRIFTPLLIQGSTQTTTVDTRVYKVEQHLPDSKTSHGKISSPNAFTSFSTGSNPIPASQFTNDLAICGRWVSVDFVATPEQFNPQVKSFQGDLYLKQLTFLPSGKTDRLYWSWENGILHHSGDNTNAKFFIKEISGEDYLFLEWMSGDVILRGQAPKYYVLKKTNKPEKGNI